MNTEFNFSNVIDKGTVYVREVAVDELPKKLREQAEGAKTLFAVHNADGEPLALVANRSLAFSLARDNDYSPVSVH